MYVPRPFVVEDRDTLLEFLASYDFATLVVGDDANHVPLIFDGQALVGHVSAANPIVASIRSGGRALAIFHGPHAYVSPRWYPSGFAIPTWNYAVVHVRGSLSELTFDENVEVIKSLIARYEDPMAPPFADVWDDPDYWRRAGATVGFRLSVDDVRSKFKLSQNRRPEDREGAIAGLEATDDAAALAVAAMMRRNPTSAPDVS